MPTYDYVCDACGHAFEEFQSFSAKHLKKCPECGKPKLRRLIGIGAGVIFKGGGFYQTDYRSDSYKKDAKADADAGKPAESKSEKSDNSGGKSESKSESKPKPEKSDSKSKPDKPKKSE